MTSGAPGQVRSATTMRDTYRVSLGYPVIGPFLAYKCLIDLNYAQQTPFSEMDHVVPGPGARDGSRPSTRGWHTPRSPGSASAAASSSPVAWMPLP